VHGEPQPFTLSGEISHDTLDSTKVAYRDYEANVSLTVYSSERRRGRTTKEIAYDLASIVGPSIKLAATIHPNRWCHAMLGAEIFHTLAQQSHDVGRYWNRLRGTVDDEVSRHHPMLWLLRAQRGEEVRKRIPKALIQHTCRDPTHSCPLSILEC